MERIETTPSTFLQKKVAKMPGIPCQSIFVSRFDFKVCRMYIRTGTCLSAFLLSQWLRRHWFHGFHGTHIF